MIEQDAKERLFVGRGRGIRVAVVDSGWPSDLAHERVEVQAGTSGGSGSRRIGHGTYCALRVLQVAPEVEVIPVRIFETGLETSVAQLCEGIEIALAADARIINLSLATRRPDAMYPLYRLCERARRDGVVVLAAAHNRGGPAIPADLEPVLSVASGRQRNLLRFSYSPGALTECTAAAASIPIPGPDGSPIRRGGSSVATATMTGIVARLLEGSNAGLDELRRMLDLTSRSPVSYPFNSNIVHSKEAGICQSLDT